MSLDHVKGEKFQIPLLFSQKKPKCTEWDIIFWLTITAHTLKKTKSPPRLLSTSGSYCANGHKSATEHLSLWHSGLQLVVRQNNKSIPESVWGSGANCAHTLMLLKYCRNGECVHLLKQRLTSRGESGEQMTYGPSPSACVIIDRRSNWAAD